MNRSVCKKVTVLRVYRSDVFPGVGAMDLGQRGSVSQRTVFSSNEPLTLRHTNEAPHS